MGFFDRLFAFLASLFGGGSSSQPSSGTASPPPVKSGNKTPRGIRNNNPFNIKWSSRIEWVGQIGSDGTFVVFDNAENGIRAGMKNIQTKFRRDGANSVRALLSILSPAFENPLENFVQFVSGRIGKAPDQPLNFDRDIIPLSKAIIHFENGEQPYSDALFAKAKARV